MARDCRHSSLRSRDRDLSAGELDWVLLETPLWAAADEDMDAYSALLVSCSRAPNFCGLLQAPGDNGQTFSKYGRDVFRPGMDWKVACATNSVIEFAVIYVDKRSTMPPHEVGQLIQSLKGAGVVIVAVVCPDLATRQALPAADAFVIGSTETTIRTAGMLAQLVCNVVQAPTTATCVDVYDLQLALRGTAELPCILAEAIWRLKPFRLEWLDSADLNAFISAQEIVLDPGPVHTQLADRAELRRHLRALSHVEDFGLIPGGAYGGFRISCDSPRVALVRLLCAPSPVQTFLSFPHGRS